MAKYSFGIDVGGTTVKMGLFNAEGEVLDKWEIVTRTENGGENVLPDIAKAILDKMEEKSIAKEDVAGVGIGVPGPVDSKGLVHKCANLGWGFVKLNEELGALLGGIPVRGGNDANVAALGEMWKGGGQGFNSIVVVTLGTGVGGGIIVDGEILTGANGAGGEIGHIHVEDDETEICGCGNCGCLEQYSSATGVVRVANRILAKNQKPTVLKADTMTCKDVWDAVKEGDEVAIEVAEQFGLYLGKALASIACVVNPEAFVIGGGVSKAGDILLEYIKKNYTPYVFHASRDVKFTLATLGNDAGIYGAAKLVLSDV
ncbi:MAG: ROK family glucokinase [Lachnospiraceae bacterium]|nr:ROK family glucokinase [Lachnospiraceae bacterium]